MRALIWSACCSMIRKKRSISAGSRVSAEPVRVAADPLMEASGARSSWLTMPRNSARSRSISSSGVMSCRVTITDSTSPRSERMEVALIRTVILRPSGTSMTISSARTVSLVASTRARGNSSRENSDPSALRMVNTSSSCSTGWPGVRRGVQDPQRLPVEGNRGSRAQVEDGHAHGGGVDKGLQVGPGPQLIPVPAGVGDDQRRLGGEHDQGLLILLGELFAGFTLGNVYVAHCGPPGGAAGRPGRRLPASADGNREGPST